jgi:hypothetical protein
MKVEEIGEVTEHPATGPRVFWCPLFCEKVSSGRRGESRSAISSTNSEGVAPPRGRQKRYYISITYPWRRERNWDPTLSEFAGSNLPSERDWNPTAALKNTKNRLCTV